MPHEKVSGIPPAEWIASIRETSPTPIIGVQSILLPESAGVSREQVYDFLNWLGRAVASVGQFDVPLLLEEIPRVNDSPVRWLRARYTMYPLYLETLEITEGPVEHDEALPPGLELRKPTVWRLSASVFTDGEVAYARHVEKWQSFARCLVEDRVATGGFSFNLLEIPADSLAANNVDVRPLVLHALDPQGAPCDRGNPQAQAAIANAFWQTFWATGALRVQRGRTFPVAFLPIDRSWSGEFESPWHSRWISLRRRFFGRSTLMAHMCECLTAAKALWFDLESLRFVQAASFDPATAGLESADFHLCLYELNRTAFVDAYIGENATVFSAWAANENGAPAPQPWSDEHYRALVNNGEQYVVDEPERHPARFVRIRRVVPYAGCAFLSEVVNKTAALARRGKIQNFSDTIVAATNSTFFLNFPEEYATLHSAMNDPVSALVEDGHCYQIKTLRRAAFVLTADGQPLITTNLGVKLENPQLVFEGESVAATYFDKAHSSFEENRVGPLNFGVVLVGNSVVETFEDMATEVPSNGWVIGDSEAFDHRIDPKRAAVVELRDTATGRPVQIRHAFAVGPLLVQDGEIVPLGESREEFLPIEVKEPPSFDEGAELPRTVLPRAIRQAPRRGVPPTRFPYDWNLTRAPRTAIGIRADGGILLVVVDGRARLPHSVGATLAELATLMKNLGCRAAMNMDGGGSSVMFVNDPQSYERKLSRELQPGVVNLPSDLGGVERLLPVALVVAKRGRSTGQ